MPETFRNLQERESRKPETVGKLHHGYAQSLKTLRNLQERERRKPETVGKFHHGCAQNLRRSAICRRGSAESLALSANFIMDVRRA